MANKRGKLAKACCFHNPEKTIQIQKTFLKILFKDQNLSLEMGLYNGGNKEYNKEIHQKP